MKYFSTVFVSELMLRFRTRSYQLFSLLIVVFTLVLTMLGSTENPSSIQVGVRLPQNEKNAILEFLRDRGGELVQFVPAEEQTIDKKILAGEWDCGLIFPDDFEKRLETLELKKIITMKTGPASTVYPIVQEAVCAGIMEWISPYIAEDYLKKIGIEEAPVEDVFLRWQQEDEWVRLEIYTANGEPLQPIRVIKSAKENLFSGLTAIFTLIWGLYLSVDLGKWLQSAAAVRFAAVCSVTQLLLPKLSASMLPVLLWGLLFLALMGCNILGLVGFFAFVLVVLTIGLILPRFSAFWQSVIAVIPFLVIAILLLEPVLLDVSIIFPEITGITRWFPVSLFLEVCSGKISFLGILLIESSLLLTASLLLDKWKSN